MDSNALKRTAVEVLQYDPTIGQGQQTIMAKPWLLQLTGN